ncbi:hypothetical protein G7Y89_g9221 [Cudoniella acicularis]|uniref:Cytochrome P450 n=1 Tax=Cudoniella acicularis TaxID=354080 RepID=A0A8H4RIS7_9HELO|nr:hypothetical protein G7Y89_g9221 [Cudoniella acicularis]
MNSSEPQVRALELTIIPLLGSVILYWVYNKVLLGISRRNFKKENNCQPIPTYPHVDPIFGFDYWYALKKAAGSRNLLVWIREQYSLYGYTYFARLQTTHIINTCEPENLKAMHSTKFRDFGVDKRRHEAFVPLLGVNSILLSNGATWKHKRAALAPSFTRSQYSNLPLFEKHILNLIGEIKAENAAAGQVDLTDYFHCCTFDITTELMYGKSVELLVNGDKELMKDMTRSAEGGQERWVLARLAKLVGNPTFIDSASRVRRFMARYVDQAIAYRERLDHLKSLPIQEISKQNVGDSKAVEADRVLYLHTVALKTLDKAALLDELTTILFAGRDSTAALLTNLFFVFAGNPEIWAKLREEISVLNGQKPTFDQLKDLQYVQSCLNESLRLDAVVPLNTRMALVDTCLPRGGGPDGKSPIFVPAGTNIAFHVTALHRRKDLWGDDAEEFRPERWEKIKGQGAWMYQPFGGGPRNCPGQHLSLTEAAYTIVRLAQEFSHIERVDDDPWVESIGLATLNLNGAKVRLTAA